MTEEALLFVHGTGTRKEGRARTMAKIVEGMASVGLASVRIDFVDWGEALGTKVNEEALASVLPLAQAMALNDVGDSDVEAAFWAELLADPYIELRMAAMRPPTKPSVDVILPGAPASPDADLLSRITSMRAKIQDPLPGEIPADRIRSAADQLSQQSLIREAALGAGAGDDVDLVGATARAIVALALRGFRAEPGTGPSALYDRDQRDALTLVVMDLLAPQTMGIGGWLKEKVKALALAKATNLENSWEVGGCGSSR